MCKCKCFDEIIEKVTLHVEKNNLPDEHQDFEVDWKDRVYSFATDNLPITAAVEFSYRPIKKDGTPAKSLRKDKVRILFDYCPFCGRKIEKETK